MTQPTQPQADISAGDLISSNKWGTFFGISQKTLDHVWKNLTSPSGNSIMYISMEIGADRDVFHPIMSKLRKLGVTKTTDDVLNHFITLFLHGPAKIPNYGGGLGILAGDTLKSFADLKIPVVGISLLYRKGYFSQMVDSQVGQISTATDWSPENTPSLYLLKNPENPAIPLEIEIPFFDKHDKQISARAQLWLKMEVNSKLDYFVPEILLDFSIPSSPDWIRMVSQTLYDSISDETKAIQRRLLGASVMPAMKALGLTANTLHLNEQHGVIVVLNMIAQWLEKKYGPDYQEKATNQDILNAADAVAEKIVFTIHTPVKAGHDRFSKAIISHIGHAFCQNILELLAKDDEFPSSFNFTRLAMRVNRATNSVSRLHKEVTRKQFPEFKDKISAITNGVHHLTWISDAKAELYDDFDELKNWRQDPSVFTKAKQLTANSTFRSYFSQAWLKDTENLIDYINTMLIQHRVQMHETWIDPPNYLSHLDENERPLNPRVFTLGFARRFSTYKRADLIFDNIDTLADIIVTNNFPVNFIYAGKAHPQDIPGQTIIRQILNLGEELYTKSNGLAKLVFIPGYDMKIAKMMVSGVHAWLNSPKRPLEASGTSGMKAALNGVPNISTMDGWWVEGYHNGQTGWKFGYESDIESACLSESPDTLLYEHDSAAFYAVFPEILRNFYNRDSDDTYINKSIANLALNCPIFNTHRMAAEYVSRYNLDLPAAIFKKIEKLRKIYQSDT
ncbi:MAG: alpha-glucan family phosphorylase [Desulfobulbaceae bacterium]|uniref:glycogen phosphorylase n=1 Tax=Candidatus Desulfobia pelagia TaxID=2841692 RepID=A0A8J6NFY1_9BACT|nr:alpha-glucan family phosphorylase [Candidatus Desulfobia pelagia]